MIYTPIQDLADRINSALPDIVSGSLAVFGDIFGGRVDNIHTIVSAEVAPDPDRLQVRFDNSELLTVWDPSGLIVGPQDFEILGASRVRWGWVSYGRPDSPENQLFIEHTVENGRPIMTSNAPWHQPGGRPSAGGPAVKILWF